MVMKARIMFLALIFFLVLAMPSFALERGGYTFELVKDSSDYPSKILDRITEPRYYTPQCLVECDMTFTMKKNTVGDVDFSRSDFSWYFQTWKKDNGFSDIDVTYLANETFYYEEAVEGCWEELRNGTMEERCGTVDFKDVESWRLIWKKIPAIIPIKYNMLYGVNIRATTTASLEKWGVDLVPMLKSIQLNEFAWWNSSFTYYANVSSNQAANKNESITFFMSEISGWDKSQMQTDCDDVRIVNASSNEQMNYYVDVCNATDVRVGFLNKYNTNGLIAQVYWGYGSAEGQNKSMRLFFDDFNDNSINTDDWTYGAGCDSDPSGSMVEQNGVLNQTTGETTACDFFWYSNTSALQYETLYSKVWYQTDNVNRVLGVKTVIKNITGSGNAYSLVRMHNNPLQIVWLSEGQAWGTPVAYPLELKKWLWFKAYHDSGGFVYGKVWNATDQNEPAANILSESGWDDREGYFGLFIGEVTLGTFDDFQVWAVGYNPTFYITESTLTLSAAESSGTPTYINWLNPANNTVATYNPDVSSDFEVSWNSTDANGYNFSIFGTNATGSWVNHTTTRSNNVSYFNITLPATTFSWKFYANNSDGDWNATDTWTKTIAKNTSMICTQSFAETTPINYGTGLTARCYSNHPDGTVQMWQNTTNVTSLNNTATVYGVGYYDYVCNVTASANYTAETDTDGFTINRGTPTFYSWIGGIQDTNSSSFPQATNVSVNQTVSTLVNECVKTTCFNTYWIEQTGDWKPVAEWNGNNPNDYQWVGWNNSLIVGNYWFKSNTTETANYSASNIIYNFIIGSVLSVDVLDELTEAGITFNLTLSNETFSWTEYNLAIFSANTTNMPYGDINIIVWSAGYDQRNYYVTVTNASNETIVGYLVQDGTQVTFTIKNVLEQPLDDIEIDIVRVLSDGWTVVAQGITDDTGAYPFYLDNNGNYKINLYDPSGEYDTKNTTLIPSGTTYTIYMFKEIYEIPSYWQYWRDITTSCAFTNATRLLECNWTDSSAHLDNITLTVTEQNLTYTNSLCINHSASSTGTFRCTFPTPKNMTYQWRLVGELSSEPTEMTFSTGSYSDILQVVLGLTGVFAAGIIILLSGSIGVQMGSPLMTVLGTMIGVGVALIIGLLTVPASVVIMMMGLFVAGGILIFKMR